ncbi:extracellular solute-binding protein [Globicatella sp. PHS-GS-PNBC-21-1553]|uniref:extracellular solute-binding protein n=1 Tax=Globicatella sp. PHS-GS-PNBC-21-1553 TaxID=2885764 RepID=UPI00298F0096|nr:extracellular solute-binding protein [Globicatella sp. PHS-GS-PNBC-21-1553]WPC08265.1 extracellular solute-binding protein [Globicatella sp. PHS-GS-PNBC-21-1553]
MKLNLKKLAIGTLSTVTALSTLVSTGVLVADAQEETLVISAAGEYDYVKNHIAKFEEEYGVKVELLDADMFEKIDGLALDGPAGTAPDVLIAPYDRIGSLAQTGLINEVTLNEEAGYDDTDKQQVSTDGVVYGAPAVIETIVLYYNKDLLPEAPKTFDELRELTKDEKYAFAGEDGKSTAFLAQWTNFYHSYGLLAGYGGYVFGEDGTNYEDLGLNSEGAVEGINYAVDWFQNVWPQGMLDVSSVSDFVMQQFTDGKAAAIIDGPWQAAAIKEAGVNFGVAKIPTLPNGEEYKPFAGGKGWVVSAFTDKQELAQEFLNWVTSEEMQTAMYEESGQIPANQAAREVAAEAGNELTTAVIDVYSNAVPMPNIPQMSEVWTGAENLMFDAGSGNKSAQEAADAAVELIKQSIEQKY